MFNTTPDVPVKKFILNMQGGKKSLLANSTNLCKSQQLAILNIKGQNGKTVKNNKLRLNIASCGGKREVALAEGTDGRRRGGLTSLRAGAPFRSPS